MCGSVVPKQFEAKFQMSNEKRLEWMENELTSQGGGALRYDGTILKVTDPRASRWKFNKKNETKQKKKMKKNGR